MVCVTRQRACELLIKHGAGVAAAKKMPLVVVHVARNGEDLLGNVSDEGKALDFLFGIAKHYSAEMVMLRSDHVVDTLCEFAEQNQVEVIVLGESRSDHAAARGIDRDLSARLPDVRIMILST
jgi:K+-sensing histidine kinase KdpD